MPLLYKYTLTESLKDKLPIWKTVNRRSRCFSQFGSCWKSLLTFCGDWVVLSKCHYHYYYYLSFTSLDLQQRRKVLLRHRQRRQRHRRSRPSQWRLISLGCYVEWNVISNSPAAGLLWRTVYFAFTLSFSVPPARHPRPEDTPALLKFFPQTKQWFCFALWWRERPFQLS